jgi:hypothetical protein
MLHTCTFNYYNKNTESKREEMTRALAKHDKEQVCVCVNTEVILKQLTVQNYVEDIRICLLDDARYLPQCHQDER